MSNSIKSNIADYLTQIENLTSTNLQILKTLNDSFFTKKNHLFAEIDNTTFVIPSFISLENKINMLQENFENLVKAPETSEAYFNFDGNTRAIEVRKYSHVPDSIKLPSVSSYNINNNDIFKDFMTPVPYINLELPKLPNDIVEVNVKKIIAKSDALKSLFKNKLAYTKEEIDENNNTVINTYYYQSNNETYGNIYKLLLNYKEDVDYIEYDTIYKLPIRKNIGSATYVIESVVSDVINDDLEEIITLKLRNNLLSSEYTNNLNYKLFNDTIEKPLSVGDELINYDGTGKVVITEVRPSTNTIVVKVVNGEYLNFLGTDSYDTNNDSDLHDLSKLRFYEAIDFDADKVLKIPLEEDQYVFIAVAALNSRMNTQSSWGTGVVIDVYSLKNGDIPFKTYYDNNVKNIGDVLLEMSNMITAPITSLSQDTFDKLTTLKPSVDKSLLSVMHINKHLNNSSTVQNIRKAYEQKKNAETKLEEIQTKINDLNNRLSTISFNDTTGIRNAYTAQLSQYNRQKNDTLAVITNAINTISLNVNSSEVPIENAKYRIRGFYVPNFDIINDININEHVIGLQIQYRYKNISSESGNAVTIKGSNDNSTYIYSDWNVYETKNKLKIPTCVDGIYKYTYESNNENINEPSYNQIDIPISQGETVDIRIKVVYDYGQPYIDMHSDWSDIINIKFPEEYNLEVPVLTIIEENNNDISTNKFNSILETSGVNSHINDSIVDNNITYYHKPDNIASGFYTEERRIIPLKDKLTSMANDIASIKSDILGAESSCIVNILLGDSITELHTDKDNTIILKSYNEINNSEYISDGVYNKEDNAVNTILNISLTNTSENVIKLYSLFPGSRTTVINNLTSYIFNKNNYCDSTNNGVYLSYKSNTNTNISSLQTCNQFITFRINDPWEGTSYYNLSASSETDNIQNISALPTLNTNTTGMIIYPYLNTQYGLCIDSDDKRSYLTIKPGEEIIIPLYCKYYIESVGEEIKKTLSFDLRTSLYKDPINYTFTVVAKYENSLLDNLQSINKNKQWNRSTTVIKYNQTVK